MRGRKEEANKGKMEGGKGMERGRRSEGGEGKGWRTMHLGKK